MIQERRSRITRDVSVLCRAGVHDECPHMWKERSDSGSSAFRCICGCHTDPSKRAAFEQSAGRVATLDPREVEALAIKERAERELAESKR